MMLDIELSVEEVENLNNGGFLVLVLEDGIRVTITKDPNYEEEEY